MKRKDLFYYQSLAKRHDRLDKLSTFAFEKSSQNLFKTCCQGNEKYICSSGGFYAIAVWRRRLCAMRGKKVSIWKTARFRDCEKREDEKYEFPFVSLFMSVFMRRAINKNYRKTKARIDFAMQANARNLRENFSDVRSRDLPLNKTSWMQLDGARDASNFPSSARPKRNRKCIEANYGILCRHKLHAN